MSDLIKSVVLASLGILSLTREKAENLAKDLIRKGELLETDEAKFVKDLLEKAEKAGVEFEGKIAKSVKDTLKKLNIPTRKDLDEIKQKLDKLSKK